MSRSDFPISIIILSILTLGVHFLGLKFYWYWHLWWFDVLMHLVGGFCATSVVLYGYVASPIPRMTSTGIRQTLVVALCIGLGIGVAWEIMELSIGMTHISDRGYIGDTASDLIDDTSGALLGFLYVYYKKLRLAR